MKIQSFYVHIIGCQQNEHDGARVNYLLEKLGFTPTPIEPADLIVVVACSVRQTAVDRVFGLVKNNPDKKIVLTGCVLDHDKKKFKLKNVDFWDIEKPEDLAKILKIKDGKKVAKLLFEGRKISSSVPIIFGCNNFCTYCATAFTRGRERSRKMSDVITDVKTLIKNGQKSILLLGQTIDSYKDPETGAGLDTLFDKLNDLEGDFIISFTSNHPKDMTDEIIEAVARLPKIKKQIHLPIQSGSDKILKAMSRPYTIEQYLNIVDNLKFKIQNLKLTTDVIVGFPGETEEDFQKTVRIFKKVKYDLAYINKYSPRAGTAAYKLGDPIPWEEKQRRWKMLNKIANKK
jgi:tRNA-2-methylthio-N6-dimethylallyladenosine synthase